MRRQRSFGLGSVLALTAALAVVGSAGRAQAQGSGASTVLRTLVYHEITSLPASATTSLVLSADGSHAVFCLPQGQKPSPIEGINADGSGLHQVDPGYNFEYDYQLDLSADGSKVVSTDGWRINLADANGARPLVQTPDSPEISAVRISGDGGRIVFTVRRSTAIKGASAPDYRGVWAINADGSGLRQLVSAAQLAQLLGVTPDHLGIAFTEGWPKLGVSTDGARLVFAAWAHYADDMRLFGVNGDGTGLHQIFQPEANEQLDQANLSADGSKVCYAFFTLPGATSPSEVGAINFDGSGRQPLARLQTPSPYPGGWLADSSDRLQLSADGSKLLMGSTGVLFDTATGAPLQLAALGGGFSSDPPPLVYDGMYRATMNGSATRFLYLAGDQKGVRQLATLGLAPGSLNGAPALSGATIAPAFVLTKGRSTATASAGVSASGSFLRVSFQVFRGGLSDDSFFSGVMFDDGTHGDARAGDSLFTNAGIQVRDLPGVEPGPRTVRIKAEARAGDGKRHATAVEIAPFAVVTDTPPAGSSSPAPSIAGT